MKLDCEKVDGVVYTCSFKDYKGQDWDKAILNMLMRNASYSHLFRKIELRLGCKDKNGFYPSYLYIVVDTEDCQFNVDEMLEAYDFGFDRRECKIGRIYEDDFYEELEDVVVEY